MLKKTQKADICLILEGTYPYVPGGVSTWTHELIEAQSHLTFHIISLLPPNFKPVLRYQVPKNVLSVTKVFLQKLPKGEKKIKGGNDKLFEKIEMPLLNIQTYPKLSDLQKIIDCFNKYNGKLGHRILLESDEAWVMILRMYHSTMGDTPFLDYFWTWRALMGGMFSVLVADLPHADVYHSLCTGYAGLMLARAHLEMQKPCLVTEHGIYTNERRIEISSADWLDDQKEFSLDVNKSVYDKELRDFWIDSFFGYSICCYEASEKIITLYNGNQEFQLMDGADPDKLMVVPNGINYNKYSQIKKENKDRPTIALIGRVVPIKDIKTFIRAVGFLQKDIPDLLAYIIGPQDEDEDYAKECFEIVRNLELEKTIEFTGKVQLTEYLGKVDIIVLTSISEAQPLVILEAGSSGIPTVATDVGACSEMIYGMDKGDKEIGPSGAVCPLSNPRAVATELLHLFTDNKYFKKCCENAKTRVYRYYHKVRQNSTYSYLYEKYKNMDIKTEISKEIKKDNKEEKHKTIEEQ